MKRVLYILLIAMVGCSKSDLIPSAEEQTALSFETDSEWPTDALATRGVAKTGFDEGDEIGLFAYKIQSDESVDNLVPNFMYNQLLSLQQSGSIFAWIYSPVKYWPSSATDRLQFFAYYPYDTYSDSSSDNDGVEIDIKSTSSDVGYPSIDFQQAIKLEDQVDFMTAQTSALEKCDVVSLEFEHQLTKVSFAARHTGVSTDVIYVTELKLTINGVQMALEGDFEADEFSYTAQGEQEILGYTLTTDNGFLLDGYAYRIPTVDENFYRTVNSTEGTLMLPAQVIAESSVTIDVTVSINRGWNEDDQEAEVEGEKTISLIVTSGHEYKAGSAIVYQFTLDLETSEVGMDIDDIVREKWNETDIDVGAEEGGSIW